MDPRSDALAAYFNIPPRLFPHLAELLADFRALGGDPPLVAGWLKVRGVGPGSRVLDLGCGKGAVAIAAARATGANVTGIDAYAPFIDEARRMAADAGVASLCDFRVGDLRDAVGRCAEHDALLYVSVGDVLGTLSESVAAIRRCVRPGGVIVIDDAYLLAGPLAFPGYEQLLGREDTRARLVAHGDRILIEHLIPRDEVQAQNRRYQSRIEQRARALAARSPGLASDIEIYLQAQRQECEILERDVQPATWLLERA
jgi:SAM-dependent methyltransferase